MSWIQLSEYSLRMLSRNPLEARLRLFLNGQQMEIFKTSSTAMISPQHAINGQE